MKHELLHSDLIPTHRLYSCGLKGAKCLILKNPKNSKVRSNLGNTGGNITLPGIKMHIPGLGVSTVFADSVIFW